jgi:hypothetical protein
LALGRSPLIAIPAYIDGRDYGTQACAPSTSLDILDTHFTARSTPYGVRSSKLYMLNSNRPSLGTGAGSAGPVAIPGRRSCSARESHVPEDLLAFGGLLYAMISIWGFVVFWVFWVVGWSSSSSK